MKQILFLVCISGVLVTGCTTRLERITPAGTIPQAMAVQNPDTQTRNQADVGNPDASGR